MRATVEVIFKHSELLNKLASRSKDDERTIMGFGFGRTKMMSKRWLFAICVYLFRVGGSMSANDEFANNIVPKLWHFARDIIWFNVPALTYVRSSTHMPGRSSRRANFNKIVLEYV